ncbi:MAG: SURF1 family protein [Legionellaceae bacterium]|nr:SURF1 family protein [Legionellaceae bacterium]
MLVRIVQNKWFLLLLTVVFVALFVRLGIWQIQRGQVKEQMQRAQQEAQRQALVPLASLGSPQAYQAVSMQGYFGSQVILLDNQHWQHRFGYRVFSPFYSDDGQVILVDRGWVAGDPSRRTFPEILVPPGHQTVLGQVWYPALRSWNIGPQLEKKNAHLLIIEQADPALTRDFLQQTPTAFLLRLAEENPYGFVREWPEQRFSPQRHYGYAVQWFAMALTLIILYIVLNRRKNNAIK